MDIFKIKKNKIIYLQLLKFGSIGILGSFLNYLSFFILYYYISINYLVSGLIAFLLPIPIIFYLNRNWTFNSKISNLTGLYSYLIVCIFGLLGHTSVLFSLTEFLSIDPLISQIPAIFTSAIINFLLAKFVVFKK